jgi:hypothetical protein
MMVVQQTAPAQPADPNVEDELDQLATMAIVDLRKRYRELLRSGPPKAFGPDLLRCDEASRIGSRRRPTGVSPYPRGACSINW